MKKLKLFSLILIALLVITTSACNRGGGTGTGRTDTLIVGAAAMPANLDPALTNDIPSARLIFHIYDTLVYIDYDLEPQPNLAERWEWVNPANPMALRVFLRRGVRFHNGDTFTANDVKFTLERNSQSPPIANVAGMIDSVTVVNDYEAIINLSYPFVPFVHFLGHTGNSIVNERAITELGTDAHSRAPVGTGPYRVTNVIAGDRVEFVRWDDYWDTPAIIENLVVRSLADASTRLIALETGEIDIMLEVPPPDMSRVRNHQDLTLYHESNLSTNYISFNVARPPFNDVRVGHAIQHAIDLNAMVEAVYLGALTPTTGPINNKVWASAADRLQPFAYNPERARQLLAEAGFPNGFSATFLTNEGNPQRFDTAEIMQNMLRAVGIDMSIQILEWGTFLDVTARGESDIYMLGWVTSTGDPDHGLYAMFHSSLLGAGGNRTFYVNPEVDRLLDAGRVEPDPVRRAEIYYQIQQIIRDDSPWIFQSAGAEIIGVRNNVRGFRVAPNQRHKFYTLSLN